MFVLALDTSTPACTVAVVELDAARGLLREASAVSVVDARRHGEALAPAVRSALDQAQLAPGALGAVVAGVGPGPYTSLRVGVVTAVALGQALAVPVHGVCSLDGVPPPPTVPAAALTTPALTTWAVVTDARRREVFWATYAADGTRTSGPAVGTPASVADALREQGVVAVVGPGLAVDPAAFGPLAAGDRSYPDPAKLVARVPLEVLVDPAPSLAPLVPIYLRRPDATQPRRPTVVVG